MIATQTEARSCSTRGENCNKMRNSASTSGLRPTMKGKREKKERKRKRRRVRRKKATTSLTKRLM